MLTQILIGDISIHKNNKYKYNDNGRIIIPSKDIIDSLPEDGGELWNRLIFEKSPYLLQHAANPVDWYPWSENVFKLAKKLNKPIFLSIGYTTCHWCHVMEHESFEDNEVAKLMNDTFVNIKVDREERPDVDNIYMEVTQNLTGRGGWPMTVIMTPDKEPFFAGTYFPKNSLPRYNRKGMLEIVPTINRLWNTNKDSLINSAKNIIKELNSKNNTRINKNNIPVKDNLMTISFNSFERRFDEINGGFKSSRNKFPKPHDYIFLLKYYYSTKNSKALEIVNKSLYEMKKGGMYDQIGYGFHRYSTDQEWLVPHFEKMLYDQALLIHAYLDAFLLTNDDYYAQTVAEICDYVLREMTSLNGGFYSAEDADSEGEEGVFYIWESNELKSFLDENEYNFIKYVLNIKDEGNAIVERHKTNIPNMTGNDWVDVSEKFSIDIKNVKEYYNNIRKKIFKVREERVHPQKDDKILTDWNGLMISSLARAYVILDNDIYLKEAQKSADFIIKNLIKDDGTLLKGYRDGNFSVNGMIEDYSFFIWGLIELYQADFNYKYLEIASQLSDYQIENFWDNQNYGFYFTSKKQHDLIIRNKEIYDGAIPSGNSVSAYNFIRLGRILSNVKYEEIAYKIVDCFSYDINRYSTGSTMLLQAMQFMEGPSFEVIIVADYQKNKDIISSIQKNNQPNKVLILKDQNSDNHNLLKYLSFYKADKNKGPLVYVCKNYSCKLPTNNIDDIEKMLR